MLDSLGNLKRTHYCGELRAADDGREVVLMGWVHRRRDLGNLLFLDLRDRTGLVQIMLHVKHSPQAHEKAEVVRPEFVVAVEGKVARREKANPGLATGEVEVIAGKLHILNNAKTPPFQIEDEINASEETRLRYRDLDLRRAKPHGNLALRHKIVLEIRKTMDELGFLEIETPMLTRSTPEGARDYLVPSRIHHGQFYALPQSPQMFKQILMIAGMDRYFQLARCLRDEDLRADRQPEHTQIDLEMSFVAEEDVFTAVEGLMAAMWKECLGIDVKTPFPRLTFREAMMRFGTDKPDVRFGLEFVDVTALCARSPRRVIADGAKAVDGTAAAMVLPGGAEISGTQLRKYEDVVKAAGGGGLTFFKVQAADREKQQIIFPGELLDEFLAAVKARDGDAVVFTNGPWERTLKALGVLRTQLGPPLLKGKEDEWRFLWVRDFPLF